MKVNYLYTGVCLAALLYTGCKPKIAKDEELPAPGAAVIARNTYLPDNDPDRNNAFIFSDATPGGFISSWDFGGLKTSTKSSDTMFFAYAGSYQVKLTSASKGGTTTTTQDVVIANNSPFAADFEVTNLGDYRFIVKVTTPSPLSQKWVFANGESSAQSVDTVYFPFAGTYNIALTTNTVRGASTRNKTVTVASDDASNPDLTDDVFIKLTGGPSDVDGKTWIIADNRGVGPLVPSDFSDASALAWYKNTGGIPGPEWVNGARANEFTFVLKQYQFVPKNQKATIHYDAANKFFGKTQAQYADIALEDPNMKQSPFLLRRNPSLITPVKYSLTFTNGAYLGYNENRSYYEIVNITSDTLYIRQPYNDVVDADPAADGGARYFKYAAKK